MRKMAVGYQRDYRGRNKTKEGGEYHEKDRKRVKEYYKPVNDMSSAKQKEN